MLRGTRHVKASSILLDTGPLHISDAECGDRSVQWRQGRIKSSMHVYKLKCSETVKGNSHILRNEVAELDMPSPEQSHFIGAGGSCAAVKCHGIQLTIVMQRVWCRAGNSDTSKSPVG